jgi:hypothetical protein
MEPEHLNGSPGAAVKLLPCDYEVMGKQPLVEIQRNATYIRPKAVGPFLGPSVSRSYMWTRLPFYCMC